MRRTIDSKEILSATITIVSRAISIVIANISLLIILSVVSASFFQIPIPSDSTATSAPTIAPAEAPTRDNLEASISAERQDIEIKEPVVHINSLTLPEGGFAVVYKPSDKYPELGVSPKLDAGTHVNVNIILDSQPETGTIKITISLYRDSNGNNEFEYLGADAPYIKDAEAVSINIEADFNEVSQTATGDPSTATSAPTTPTPAPALPANGGTPAVVRIAKFIYSATLFFVIYSLILISYKIRSNVFDR